MRILSFDPGARTGWAFIKTERKPQYRIQCTDAGVLTIKQPRKTIPHPTPILRFYNEAIELIRQTAPDWVVIEDMFRPKQNIMNIVKGMYKPRLLLTLAAHTEHVNTRDIAPATW